MFAFVWFVWDDCGWVVALGLVFFVACLLFVCGLSLWCLVCFLLVALFGLMFG